MCIICLEFQRTKDLADARLMLANARREPGAIDREHLEQVAKELEVAAEGQGELPSLPGN